MTNPGLNLALALAVGVVAQALARHLKLPGIVILLATGVLLGPDGAGLIFPDALGPALPILVSFAVAIILFEGGLNLDIKRLRQAQRSIRQLVIIGPVVSAVGGFAAALLVLEWPWRTALLFGSLIIVTGPTVITPLLRRVRVDHEVSTVLEAEGVLIDAIGAVFAAFALEIALSPSGMTFAVGLGQIALRLALGIVIGLAGGFIIAFFLRKRDLIPEGLENTFTLCLILAVFQISNALLHESGIAAVTVAGIVVGNRKTAVHHDLLEFKEQLTVMLIGMLFVLLAADVRVEQVQGLGWKGVATVLIVIFVIRPASVFIATYGTELNLRQKLFMSWIGPRGIIAAAIASIFATELEHFGLSGGPELRALVFLVIAITVLLAGLTGGPVARLLGLREEKSGWLILGAHGVARMLGNILKDNDQRVGFIDTNWELCLAARRDNFESYRGNALDENVLARARINTRLGVVGLSANEEVNLLFVQKVRRLAKGTQLLATVGNISQAVTPKMVDEAGAEMLFGKPIDIEMWDVRIRQKAVTEIRRMYQRPTASNNKPPKETEEPVKKTDSKSHPIATYLPLAIKQGKRVTPYSESTEPKNENIGYFVVYTHQLDDAEEELTRLGWLPIVDKTPEEKPDATE